MTQAANDKQQVVPLIEAIQEQSGQRPEEVLADSGYCSEENLKYLAKRRMAGFVATEKQKHGERSEPVFGQIKQARGFRQFLLRGWRKYEASGL